MTCLVRGRVVTPDRVIDDGVVAIDAGRIVDVRPAGRTGVAHYRAPWVLPGFVDIHVHGGAGHSVTTGDPAQARAVAAFHAAHGTTTMLASLIPAPYPVLRAATLALGSLVADGILAGVHYEGPYLSTARCGALPREHHRDPDRTELTSLLDLDAVKMVTLAPELPGALDLIGALGRRGVVAAVGHTDATYRQTLAAVEAGARVGTHVGNAMPPIHHREPGPILALLESPGVVCEVIADGVHLHDAMLRHIVRAAGPDRVALVTDAMAAAGMPDGEYELGGRPVLVTDGVARLIQASSAGRLARSASDGGRAGAGRTGALAGSTLTMDRAVRHLVHSGVDIGATARMAATTPARALGLDRELGAIVAGLRADLVLLDAHLRVVEVLRAGRAYLSQSDSARKLA